MNKSNWLVATAVCALFVASPALADDRAPGQQASDNHIEEIVVTAQKRAENVQTVPLSIVAMSGNQLAKAGVQNILGLQAVVPSLTLTTIAQSSGVAIRIRGFGTASNAAIDPDVASYIDGIYIPRPGALLTNFLDVANVQVLRGPQGTLFGRNSTVGALELVTNAPELGVRSGQFSTEVSSYRTLKGTVVANIPAGDAFAVRLAGFDNTTRGYIHNHFDNATYGGSNSYGGRLSAKWAVSSSLTWEGKLDYAQISGDGINPGEVDVSTASAAQLAAFTARLGVANTPTLSATPGFEPNQRFDSPSLLDQQGGASSTFNLRLADGGQFRLIDSVRGWADRQNDGDVVMTGLDLVNRHAYFHSKSQSHELQFISPKDKYLDGRLTLVAGLYYFREEYTINTILDLGSQYCSFVVAAAKPSLLPGCNGNSLGNATNTQFNQVETSWAGYVQADLKLARSLTLTLGARETHDKKTGTYLNVVNNPGGLLLAATENDPNLAVGKTKPTWRANLSWTPTNRIMVFASYSTGYKSGGFNSTAATSVVTPSSLITADQATAQNTANRTFQSETSADAELGIKSRLFGGRLQLNADIYQTDITGYQDKSFNGLSFIVRNAGNVRTRGVEVDGQFIPTDHIKIDFGGDYLHSIYSLNTGSPGLPACTGAATSCPTVQDLTGRTTTFAPKWQGNLAIEYSTSPFWGGYVFQIRPEISYLDKFNSTTDLNPQGIINARTLAGLRLVLVSPGKAWNLTIFGTNLTDERYFTQKFVQTLDSLLGVRTPLATAALPGASLMRGYVGAPRTFGVRLGAKF